MVRELLAVGGDPQEFHFEIVDCVTNSSMIGREGILCLPNGKRSYSSGAEYPF